jgi:hypothetical protein
VKSLVSALVVLLFVNTVYAQQAQVVKGRVIDQDSREPLAFVNIVINDGKTGISTDIDGKFSVKAEKGIYKLTFSYIGYETKEVNIPNDHEPPLEITLTAKKIDLEEVVIYPTENPAHRIIDSVVQNRARNDPDKLKSYAYTTYEKTILTVQMDSLIKADTAEVDSNLVEIQEFFEKQDIAIMESVTEKKFISPDLEYQNVLANRVSGFRDPIFVFLISQWQSSSFYDDLIHISDKHYVNPISKGSTNKYFFLIEDTTYTGRGDTVFIISYRPRKNTNFDGLEGLLYINSYKWAVQNVIAHPAEEEGMQVRIQQMYELIDGEQWFPIQLNTDIIFMNFRISSGEEDASMVGIGKSYIRDIELNPGLVRRQFDVLGLDVEPDSHEKPEEFWNAYRIDSLSARDLRTYEFMDSIGKEANLDRLSTGVETILNGKVRWKFIDIDLDKIIKYNGYQGLYLGMGLHTNDLLSKRLKFGGYWGYGFRDMTAKYGGDIRYTLNRRREVDVWARYHYDLVETGGVDFMGEEKGLLTGNHWRELLINRLNLTEDASAGISFRLLRDFKFHLGFSSNTKMAAYDYRFGYSRDDVTIVTDEFDFTEIKAGFRWAFREEFLVTKRSRISLGTKYPVVMFQYTRGLKDVLEGGYAYDRYDLRVDYDFYTTYLGHTHLRLNAGLINGDVPFCNLYNGNGSYREFTVYAPYSFATMRMNEFLSDRYIALYFTHDFGKLIFKRKGFQPEFLIATHAAFGMLSNTDVRHLNVNYKTLEHGYFESGLVINNLLDLRIYSLGIGAFYRWGGYSMPTAWENLALKFSIVFPFGR